jgi:hypothetical protein
MGTEEPVKQERAPKDKWDKLDILMKPIGGVITALTIALISYLGSVYLNNKQNNDAKNRLYTELMSSREQSESALRKDMFNSILSTILKDTSSIDENILKLELLAYNFHESLNLMPLFDFLNRKIVKEKNAEFRKAYRKRLYKVAKNVATKQISSLEGVVKKADFFYVFNQNADNSKLDKSHEFPIDTTFSTVFVDSVKTGKKLDLYTRQIWLKIISCNIDEKTVNMRLTIQTIVNNHPNPIVNREFSIDYFQFPMIDNTRLSNDMRCAVVLTDFVFPRSLDFSILYFPGSHSSLKEQPYYDEVMKKLLLDN